MLQRIFGFRLLAMFGLLFALSGCIGEEVEVPTAHRGMISTSTGLKEEVLPPSKKRLSNFCLTCDSLIIAEISDYGISESFELYMPKDRLNLSVEVRGTFATSDTENDLKMIFSRVSAAPAEGTDRVKKIDAARVYQTYAQQIVREKSRSVLAKYDIATVMENRDSIGAELHEAVVKALEGRPVKVLNFGLNDAQPPEIVMQAELTRKTREIAIQQADANKEVALREAQAALEVAEMQQAVDLKQAETQVMVEQKLKQGFSGAYVAQRGLRILEELAASENQIIFLPTEALSNPSIMIGGLSTAFDRQNAAMDAADETIATAAEEATVAPIDPTVPVEAPAALPEVR